MTRITELTMTINELKDFFDILIDGGEDYLEQLASLDEKEYNLFCSYHDFKQHLEMRHEPKG